MMKKTIFSSLVLLLGAFVLTSCVKTDDVVDDTSSLWYHEAGNLVTIGGDDTQAEFLITSDCPWRIETEAGSWVSVQPQTGKGSQRVTVVAASTNPSSTEARRTAFVIVTQDGVRKRVVVEQAQSTVVVPPAPVLEVSPAYMEFGAAENTARQIAITSSSLEWTVSCNADWVHLSVTTGTGDAAVGITVDNNLSTTAREATITVEPTTIYETEPLVRRITIRQEAGRLQAVSGVTVVDVDETEARVSSTLTDTQFPVTGYGFCIGTEANPSETGEKRAVPGTLQVGNTFTSTLTGLNKKTHYYVCAYATTAMGTVYSSVADFETLSIPKEGDLDKPNH